MLSGGQFGAGIQDKIRHFLTALSSLGNNKEDPGAGSVSTPPVHSSSIAIGFAFGERFVRSWHATCDLPDA